MAIPTDYVFTSGTCQKKDFYGVLTAALIAAGWVNVSSLASSDYEVYTSAGNTDDKALVLNLRKGSTATPANDVSTTAYCQFSYRLPTSYTPGAAGVAGTFVRPDVWRDIYIAPVAAAGTLAMDTVYSYKIYADKSKIIFSIEFPGGTGYSPMLVHIGLPDTLYCAEAGNRGLVVGVTCGGVAPSTAAAFLVSDTPDGMGSNTACYVMPYICTLSPKNPNNAGKYVVSDIYYGSALEGVRGKIDGILALPAASCMTGDNITIGSQTYYVLNCNVQGINNFPSLALAVRII